MMVQLSQTSVALHYEPHDTNIFFAAISQASSLGRGDLSHGIAHLQKDGVLR